MRPPLGQHFLRDLRAVHTILSAAELSAEDTVLEIGPGRGVLTDALAGRVRRVVAVELDAALAARLQARAASHTDILHADFLKVDLPSLFAPGARAVKVLGNLPYSITSPIFEKLLPWTGWQTGVFLVQQEVAERMKSPSGLRSFGILSLAVQLFAEVEALLTVKPGAFIPPPRVTSTVIRLRRKPAADLPPEWIPAFFDLAHGAFAHRRKTLANSLAFFSRRPKKEVEKWLEAERIEPIRRAETLALADYVRMAHPWAIFRRETKLT